MSFESDLRLSAAASQLGREIFMARKAAYGTDESWQALTFKQRSAYLNQALDMLKALKPLEVVK
jgi:acyl-CoA reductase-like NAD-dependent aldehyde dehydrogenase